MKQSIIYLVSALALFGQFNHAQAAVVEVKWSNSDKYLDMDAGEEHRKHFKTRTFTAFEEHFAKLAASLPDNQKLVFDVTNVDLAGDVNFGGTRRVRVVKSIFFPRLDFSYQLLNADNTVAKSAEISLKDMGFLTHTGIRYRNKSLSYEKEMLDDWFKKTFAGEVIK
jgi:hypothetical protein